MKTIKIKLKNKVKHIFVFDDSRIGSHLKKEVIVKLPFRLNKGDQIDPCPFIMSNVITAIAKYYDISLPIICYVNFTSIVSPDHLEGVYIKTYFTHFEQ